MDERAKEVISANSRMVPLVEITIGDIVLLPDGFPVATLVTGNGTVIATLIPGYKDSGIQVNSSTDPYNIGAGETLTKSQLFGLNNLFDATLGSDRDIGTHGRLGMSTAKFEFMRAEIVATLMRFCQDVRYRTARAAERLGVPSNVVYIYCSAARDSDLGDGRRLSFVDASAVDVLTAYTVRYYNPEMYMAITVTVDPSETQEARLAAYDQRIADWHNNDDETAKLEWLKGWRKELADEMAGKEEIVEVLKNNPIDIEQ